MFVCWHFFRIGMGSVRVVVTDEMKRYSSFRVGEVYFFLFISDTSVQHISRRWCFLSHALPRPIARTYFQRQMATYPGSFHHDHHLILWSGRAGRQDKPVNVSGTTVAACCPGGPPSKTAAGGPLSRHSLHLLKSLLPSDGPVASSSSRLEGSPKVHES